MYYNVSILPCQTRENQGAYFISCLTLHWFVHVHFPGSFYHAFLTEKTTMEKGRKETAKCINRKTIFETLILNNR